MGILSFLFKSKTNEVSNEVSFDLEKLKLDFQNKTDFGDIQLGIWNGLERLYIGNYYKGYRNELYKNNELLSIKIKEQINSYEEIIKFLTEKYDKTLATNLINRIFTVGETTIEQVIYASQKYLCRYYLLDKQEEQSLKDNTKKKTLLFRVPAYCFPSFVTNESFVYQRFVFKDDILSDVRLMSKKY